MITIADVREKWTRLCDALYDVANTAEVASSETAFEEDELRVTLNYCEKLIAVLEADE